MYQEILFIIAAVIGGGVLTTIIESVCLALPKRVGKIVGYAIWALGVAILFALLRNGLTPCEH